MKERGVMDHCSGCMQKAIGAQSSNSLVSEMRIAQELLGTVHH